MYARRWFPIFASLLLFAACGGSGDGSAQPDGGTGGGGGGDDTCVGDGCGKPCASDSTCAIGYHCGDEAVCTAECQQGTASCGADAYCDSRGYCQDGAPPQAPPDGGVDCPAIQVRTEPIVPTVQLLIDFSGSMDEDFNGERRSDAVSQALFARNNGVVANLESQVRFGATLYTSFNGDDNPPCPRLDAVAPDFDNLDTLRRIADRLESDDLGEDTPTGEAIDAVVATFPPPKENDKPIIVLATDGEPDTCTLPDPDNANQRKQARDRSESAAQRAFSEAGIELYILSVGADISEAHLQRMANAGVGKAFDEASDPAPVYVANNQAELTGAFEEIIGNARECKFALGGTVTDPQGGTVTLNGSELQYQIDWDITDGGNSLELLGATCDDYKDTQGAAELDAEFECGSVIDVPIE